MNLSKLSPRFRKPKVAAPAVPPPDSAAAPVEAVKSEAVEADAVATPPCPEPASKEPAPKESAPKDSAPKASRLVEGVRPSLRDRLPTGAVLGAFAKASSAVRPAAKPLAAATAVIAALGLGYGVGLSGRSDSEAAAAARWSEAAAGLRESNGEIARLAAELKTVKTGLDGLRGDRDRSRGDLSAKQAQLIDRVERAGQDNAARIGKLGEQLDRMEKAQKDPTRTQALIERLDRLDKGSQTASLQPAPSPSPALASAPTPPSKPVAILKEGAADVQQTGSIAEPKKPDVGKPDASKPEPDPRKTQLKGYAVRDIDDGYALIEMKSGRFVEVAVGQTLPGIGRVEAIERRGRQWVVVTAKGFVGERWN